MLKRSIICALTLCLLLCAAAYAESAALAFPGTGTEEDPYQIAAKEDLIRFAAFVNQEYDSENWDALHAHYQLTADIVLNDCSNFENWADNPPELSWTPIGNDKAFDGSFDGNGHTISGLYIDQKCENSYTGPNSAFGLFGHMSAGSSVKNLNVTHAYIHPEYVREVGGTSAGIIAGSSAGTITDCHAEGIVICEGGAYGGIVGTCSGECSNSSFSGKMIERTVYAGDVIGGIAGNGGTIDNCTVTADLFAEKSAEDVVYADMGGIVGSYMGVNTLQNCTFNGTIRSEASAGGIAGLATGGARLADDDNQDGKPCLILNCINEGSVTAAGDAGGIVGVCNDRKTVKVVVDSCINRGDVLALDDEIYAVGGIVGSIDTRHSGSVILINCTNEKDLSAFMVGGIVGQARQNTGSILIENCTNKGIIRSEGLYAGGILCQLMQWGDEWSVVIEQCVNEGDIFTNYNAGGILCFAYDADPAGKDRSMTISDCTNRGNITSSNVNNYMGGILGVNTMQRVPLKIAGCINEGNLEYTKEIVADAETLSGTMLTLSRISGGIVGYTGIAPFITVNSGERKLDNINVENAYLVIENCASTGEFAHKDARLADDVTEELLEKWRNVGVDNVLDFFAVIEGGIVGTIADDENFSVNIQNCSFENAESEISTWTPRKD